MEQIHWDDGNDPNSSQWDRHWYGISSTQAPSTVCSDPNSHWTECGSDCHSGHLPYYCCPDKTSIECFDIWGFPATCAPPLDADLNPLCIPKCQCNDGYVWVYYPELDHDPSNNDGERGETGKCVLEQEYCGPSDGPACPENSWYTDCGSPCDNHHCCDGDDCILPDCSAMGCAPMCICNDGYIMDDNGDCKPDFEVCRSRDCGQNEVWTTEWCHDDARCCPSGIFDITAPWSFCVVVNECEPGMEGCRCAEGHARDPRTGLCIHQDQCSEPPQCPENEVYADAAGPCNEPNCEGWGCSTPRWTSWKPGCICAEGYTRLNGVCVTEQECRDEQCGANAHHSDCVYNERHCCNGHVCHGRKGKNGQVHIDKTSPASGAPAPATWAPPGPTNPWTTNTPGTAPPGPTWYPTTGWHPDPTYPPTYAPEPACYPGCTCDDGYIWRNGECIREEECIPECHDGQEWREDHCWAAEAHCCQQGVCHHNMPGVAPAPASTYPPTYPATDGPAYTAAPGTVPPATWAPTAAPFATTHGGHGDWKVGSARKRKSAARATEVTTTTSTTMTTTVNPNYWWDSPAWADSADENSWDVGDQSSIDHGVCLMNEQLRVIKERV